MKAQKEDHSMKVQKQSRAMKVWVVSLGVLLFIGGIAGCSTEKSAVSAPYTSMVGPAGPEGPAGPVGAQGTVMG